jgi:hypothetical protein
MHSKYRALFLPLASARLQRRALSAQALFLGPQLGREFGAKIVGLEHAANFDLGLAFHRIRAAPDPFDSLFHGLDLPQPELGDEFLALRERPIGMLVGGLLAIPSLRLLRAHCGRYLCSLFAQNLMCSGWMLIGMTAGALWLSRWAQTLVGNSLPAMLGGMFMGMIWGMVLSVALYRGFFAWRAGHPKR